jgi:hypothetical protein
MQFDIYRMISLALADLCEVWGSNSGGFDEKRVLDCDTM